MDSPPQGTMTYRRSAMKSRPSTPMTSPTMTSPMESPPSIFSFLPGSYQHSLPVRPPMYGHPSSSSTVPPSSSTTATSQATPLLFSPKVSFDTFENPAASMFSFTLSVKSDGYVRTRSTRVFLCASSADESGREALDWSLESLAQDGDELIVCRGVDQEELGAWALLFLKAMF